MTREAVAVARKHGQGAWMKMMGIWVPMVSYPPNRARIDHMRVRPETLTA